MTIGEFSRATRLSLKALRLYDELGLLRPTWVDPSSGYRHYAPELCERARLVAWLRRIGMPLSGIREVCDAEATTGATLVARFWDGVVADTTARGQLATFLVDYLSGRDTAMTTTTIEIRYAARTDIGLERDSNEDIAFASDRVLAVADGTRGRGGARASALAIEALTAVPANAVPVGDLLNVLADAVSSADRAIGESHSTSGEDITTLTAMVWSGSQLALVHVGDTRAYLARDGEFVQITHDHTYVQSLVDSGALSADEAQAHPQRALLIRAIDGTGAVRPDLSLHEALAGDRYLLCSDGLSAVVPESQVRAALGLDADPERVVAELVELARRNGAPDNIACVVADVVAV